jgi:hypothetical protein
MTVLGERGDSFPVILAKAGIHVLGFSSAQGQSGMDSCLRRNDGVEQE